MRTPGYWQHDGLLALLLSPISHGITAAGRMRRAIKKTRRIRVPVLCVGNLVAGGAGKTPVAIAVAERLIARGATPHFLSRGYGGDITGPTRVDPTRHRAEHTGDEALLLARTAPCWIARHRPAGGAAAAHYGADVVVMDDGFQNPSLRKNLSLVVIDGGYGLGNRRVLPAGPLREPFEDGIGRADAVVLLGEDEQGILETLPETLPVLRANIVPANTDHLTGKTVFAFAGIARPEKFYATLEAIGCHIADTRSFDDHHNFNPAQIGWLLDKAAILEALPVTTEKDWVRLPEKVRDRFATLPITVRWQDSAALDALLDRLG